MKFVIFAITFSLIIICCQKDKIVEENIKINTCKNYSKAGKDFTICFDELLEDSRCPANAFCTSQGSAVVKLLLKENNRIVSFLLRVGDNNGINSDTTINGNNIKLVNINPYPGVPETRNNKYSVELRVK